MDRAANRIEKYVQKLDADIFSVVRQHELVKLYYDRETKCIHFRKPLFSRDIILRKCTFYRYVKFMNRSSGYLYSAFTHKDKCFFEYCCSLNNSEYHIK